VEVGRWAGETADVVLGVGRRMAGFAEAARAAGRACVEQADDAAAALAWLKQSVRPGDAVLVKASRLAGLDRVADGLRPGGVSPGRVSGV
jgi:UDP-N-acetylmuramoyl-tripeptide--D-alanyl-D-alanine ligase